MTKGGADNQTMEVEEWVDQYDNLVFSICFKIIGNYFDAQDVAQETFLSAYCNQEQFDGTHVKAWLCRIATNKSLDFMKRAERRAVPTKENYFHALTCDKPSTEEIVMEDAVKQQLLIFCEQLKPPYDEVAKAYFYHEQEVAEIAKRKKKNIKTIQTQIYRAKGMLRKLWKPLEKGVD